MCECRGCVGWAQSVRTTHTLPGRGCLQGCCPRTHPTSRPPKPPKSPTRAPLTLSWSLRRLMSGLQVLTTSLWLDPIAQWTETASPAINTIFPGWPQSCNLAPAGTVREQGGGVPAARLAPATTVLYLTRNMVFWRLVLLSGPYRQPAAECLCLGLLPPPSSSVNGSIRAWYVMRHGLLSSSGIRTRPKGPAETRMAPIHSVFTEICHFLLIG